MSFIEFSAENGVGRILLNRPEKLNAFAGTMREELISVLEQVRDDRTLRVVVITGAGRGFCAGGDVEYMSGLQKRAAVDEFRPLLEAGRRIITLIREIEIPFIASINGVAAGAGCNLALACDYRLASSKAKLGETFTKIGIHPDWGGTFFLPRLVGTSKALELMITGRLVEAAEALSIGMVDRVVEPDTLQQVTSELAAAFAAAPPIAVRGIKRALEATRTNLLGEQIDLETKHQIEAFLSSDAAEGMGAFFEKRVPLFRGA